MRIELLETTVGEAAEGFADNDEEGVADKLSGLPDRPRTIITGHDRGPATVRTLKFWR